MRSFWACWLRQWRGCGGARAQLSNGDGGGFAFSAPRTRARVRERLRASERADGRGLFAVDRGQRRQAGHGAWRPRGGNVLLLVGTVAQLKI